MVGVCFEVYGWVVLGQSRRESARCMVGAHDYRAGRMIAVQGARLPCRAHDCREGRMIAVQSALGKGRMRQLHCVKRMRNSDVRWGRDT